MYLRPDKQYAASFMSDIDIHIKELEFLKNIILKHGTKTEIKKNSFFIQRGHFCHEIAYIVRGSFKFLRHDAKGAEHIMAFAFEKEIISSYLPSRKGCDALLDVKALEDSVVIQAPLETLRPFLQISVDGEIYVRAFVESLAFDFLKKIICLSTLIIYCQVKITRTHIIWTVSFFYHGIRSQNMICGKNCHILCSIFFHDF